MTIEAPRCPICHGKTGEILNLEHPKHRVGWVCWNCWPAEHAFIKAMLRERIIEGPVDGKQ